MPKEQPDGNTLNTDERRWYSKIANKTTTEHIEKYVEIYGDIARRIDVPAAAAAILREVSQDERLAVREKLQEHVDNGCATEKQLAYLKRLGVDAEPGIGKAEASRLIDEALERGD